MNRTILSVFLLAAALATVAVAARQPSADDERRAAIKLLRAINTAENAAGGRARSYLPLAELLNHPAMGGVKADIAVSGNSFTYAGAQVRLALAADASQYVVTVVSGKPNYTAAFTDERGVIYTGEALK